MSPPASGSPRALDPLRHRFRDLDPVGRDRDGDCSYAVVEFDRVVTTGDQSTTVPMRATVLLRHQKGEPHFRIFHWHASLRDEVRTE